VIYAKVQMAVSGRTALLAGATIASTATFVHQMIVRRTPRVTLCRPERITMDIDKDAGRVAIESTPLLDQRLDDQLCFAEEDLTATRGVCGNGTPACRLWHRLDQLVKFVRSNNLICLKGAS
jgi:hypothetical protein